MLCLACYSLTCQAETLEYIAPKQEVVVEKTIEEKIREAFPEDSDRAVQIAKCESGLRPEVVSHTNDSGIFQINHIHDKRLNELGLDKFNPDDNIKYARMLYDERGWKPWVCYTKGLYTKKSV